MKKLAGFVIFLLMGAGLASATTCPTTPNTNTDCGYIITIGPGGVITGAAVTGAAAYDGSDDALVGVINNSGATYTGSIALSSTNDIFGFDGDGICTFIGPGGNDPTAEGSYCSTAQVNGVDPGDYEGPLNTFSNYLSTTSGDVDITGLGAGASTFFSLEGAPNGLGIVVTGTTPEPSSLVLLSTGLLGSATILRRRFIKG